MATVVKDFKIKSGLIVEGANATVGGYSVLKKLNEDDEDYIRGLVGGSGTPDNIPDTLVQRDENGDFAAGIITAETNFSGDLTGDVTGTVSDISNHTTDSLTEGANNKYFSDFLAQQAIANNLGTGIVYSAENAGNVFHIDENVVATKNYIDTLTTSDIEEGFNEYFTVQRARNALSAGSGLTYDSSLGEYTANLGNGLQFNGSQIEIDDNIVATDTDISTAISNHSALTTGVHGVTGDVVGTSDAQELSNKTLGSGTTLSANLDADGFTIANLATPVNGTDAATKQYVDGLSAGISWKAAVNLLANSDVNMTGNTGTLVIDGYPALGSGDIGYRILLTNQAIDAENGIYVYTEAAGVYTLVRAADADTDEELHGAAVFVMEGTTYGSTSWVQVNHYVSGYAGQEWDQFSGAGTYIAGNGLTLDGNEFSIDTTITATKTYVDDEIDAHSQISSGIHGINGSFVGTSDTQELTNKTLGSGTVLGANLDAANTYKVVNLVDPSSNQDAATKKYVDDEISTVNTAIDNLSTTDITEGTNLYFTDARAEEAVTNGLIGPASVGYQAVSVDFVTGNLVVPNTDIGNFTTDDLDEGSTNLYYTDARVEAVIASTDTDDIDEGSTNLYFTDQRAVSALEAVVPNFTEIDINSVATQIAAASSGDAAQAVVAYQFPKADYRSAKFLVKVAYGTHTEVSEVLLTLDSADNISITEYAVVGTNGSASAISADVSGSNVRLLVTPTNNGSTIKVMGTLLV